MQNPGPPGGPAPWPCPDPSPNPAAAGPGDGRVLSSPSSLVHEPCSWTGAVALRPQTGLTGSGSHRSSCGRVRGGHPPTLQPARGLSPAPISTCTISWGIGTRRRPVFPSSPWMILAAPPSEVRISSFSSSTARKFQPGARTATRPGKSRDHGPGCTSLPAHPLAGGSWKCIGVAVQRTPRCPSCCSAARNSVPHGTRGG
jgi:hypothetical protein